MAKFIVYDPIKQLFVEYRLDSGKMVYLATAHKISPLELITIGHEEIRTPNINITAATHSSILQDIPHIPDGLTQHVTDAILLGQNHYFADYVQLSTPRFHPMKRNFSDWLHREPELYLSTAVATIYIEKPVSEMEQQIFEAIFANLEEVTDRFTKDWSICFGTKSAAPDSKVVPIPDNFSGFSRQPSEYLTRLLMKSFPSNKGIIHYDLTGDVVSYYKINPLKN